MKSQSTMTTTETHIQQVGQLKYRIMHQQAYLAGLTLEKSDWPQVLMKNSSVLKNFLCTFSP